MCVKFSRKRKRNENRREYKRTLSCTKKKNRKNCFSCSCCDKKSECKNLSVVYRFFFIQKAKKTQTKIENGKRVWGVVLCCLE